MRQMQVISVVKSKATCKGNCRGNSEVWKPGTKADQKALFYRDE